MRTRCKDQGIAREIGNMQRSSPFPYQNRRKLCRRSRRSNGRFGGMCWCHITHEIALNLVVLWTNRISIITRFWWMWMKKKKTTNKHVIFSSPQIAIVNTIMFTKHQKNYQPGLLDPPRIPWNKWCRQPRNKWMCLFFLFFVRCAVDCVEFLWRKEIPVPVHRVQRLSCLLMS